jgi:SAM-dependent methyltransferase
VLAGPVTLRGAKLLVWLSSLPPDVRDLAVEEMMGIAGPPPSAAPPGDDLIGYHASGIAPIVRALVEVPVLADDVLIDLGAGLGKVAFLAHLLTGASARGIEIQSALVHRARDAADRLGVDVRFTHADARDAEFDDGTVFFLYTPFTGPALVQVLERLREISARRAIVVCALGIDLDRHAPWLVPRPSHSFWLTIYDGVGSGAPPRSPRIASPLQPFADAVICERALHPAIRGRSVTPDPAATVQPSGRRSRIG